MNHSIHGRGIGHLIPDNPEPLEDVGIGGILCFKDLWGILDKKKKGNKKCCLSTITGS